MARGLIVIAGLVAGYVLGAAIGLGAVTLLSANTHDRGIEAVMTAAFVGGPVGAVIGLIGALVRTR
jgi:hypothetical protein